jgi:starch synthase (maltosyl-transferring)
LSATGTGPEGPFATSMPTKPAKTSQPPRIRITNVHPIVDCGTHPAKRTVGDRVEVRATVFRDGHEILGARILYRGPDERRYRSAPLELLWNDLFTGSFEVTEPGRWQFLIEAWSDRAATFRDELRRKVEAGQEDLDGELAEGSLLLGIEDLDVETALASTVSDRHGAVRSATLELDVDRKLGRFGAWYELFPRSFGGFAGVERVLPQLAELGFDVVYFPPIHPIGRSGRKGRNNTLGAGPDDPGSPWAIGAEEGGHDAIHPELGTLADFERLVAAAKEHGLEIALDFAIQCSPDHPWLKEHPGWFQHRPDGTVKYAENPPKRYQDIVNVDWECEDWQGLWNALRDVLLHWMAHGVRVFRVDNPHTKPLPFWAWLIAEARAVDEGVVFLAEAFTRPAMMHELAKVGFNQSYTYFTWRNARWELVEYLTELATEDADYFRPNFFVNTPDILSPYLVDGGRPAFEARLVLAATLSPSYGIYSGYENLENVPIRPGSEEYVDSEKYELKERAIEGPLLPLISRLNRIRRANRSFERIDNLTFLETENDQLIAYAKRSEADTVIVCVNVAMSPSEGLLVVPGDLDLPDSFVVQDLLTDDTYAWQVGGNYVLLQPGGAHIMHVR